jgi:hypothetical protein
MGKGGPLAFLAKKPWHPARFSNQEEVCDLESVWQYGQYFVLHILCLHVFRFGKEKQQRLQKLKKQRNSESSLKKRGKRMNSFKWRRMQAILGNSHELSMFFSEQAACHDCNLQLT